MNFANNSQVPVFLDNGGVRFHPVDKRQASRRGGGSSYSAIEDVGCGCFASFEGEAGLKTGGLEHEKSDVVFGVRVLYEEILDKLELNHDERAGRAKVIYGVELR